MTDLPLTPATDKEREKVFMPPEVFGRVPVVEAGKVPEAVWKEAAEEGYIEKVEKEVELPKPVTYQGQVLMTSPAAQKPKIVLPVSKQTYLNPKNWHLPVTTALRWLLTWIKRVMKMSPEGTVFQDESFTRP
jgi:hypothetical protein